ncbi:hypothetical protein OE88DRAFT_1740191 [Heliocybe sulcata]|uniref:Uncharacterized protein n=1 Tax=Heliocybe sulcata TaxID=5364 RepID=A0A5C3MKV3_9AGAM|nr:hypothetical protein OE88DRAFT_1740191 [Heliocybe sulcata]
MGPVSRRNGPSRRPEATEADKENQQVAAGNSGEATVRCSTRSIKPSDHVDPALFKNMVGSNFRPRDARLDERASDSEEEETTADDQQRETGDLSHDNSDYRGASTGRPRTQRAPPVSASVNGVNTDQQQLPSQSTFSSRTIPVHPDGSATSRLQAIQGGQTHVFPQLASAPKTAIRPPRSLVRAPSFQFNPAHHAAGPVDSTNALMPSSVGNRPSSTSLVQKRAAQDVENDSEDLDKETRRRLKKDAQNHKRSRYGKYGDDNTFRKVMRKTGYLLQVHWSTITSYPTSSHRDKIISEKFGEAMASCDCVPGTYKLSTDDEKLVSSTSDGSSFIAAH